MILVDTGPFVALFDPKDDAHAETRQLLRSVHEPLVTTAPVLTEAFHLLDPGSRGAAALREFLQGSGAVVWCFERASLKRAFELMQQYADHPMDFADASLVAAAEHLRTTRIFTLASNDFATYRARIGRSWRGFKMFAPYHDR